MDKESAYKLGLDVLYLASCALGGRLPERSRLLEMDLPKVYKMAKKHSMQAITYISLSRAIEAYGDIQTSDELMEGWKKEYVGIVNKLVRLDIEREAVYSFFEENGIWYVGLKGIELSHYYPTLGMRQMGDNDILVDKSYCPKIRDYFLSRGYKVESYGNHCHDVYVKGWSIFEIHRTLADDADRTKTAARYYKNVKSRLIPDEGRMSHRFSDDDFYVYYIFHAYKHYSAAGCGMRTLMDIYLYNSKMGERLNYKYIEEQNSLLGTNEYEKASRRIADAIFSLGAEDIYSADLLDEGDREILLYYISSGTFGTRDILIDNELKNMSEGGEITGTTKLKYYLRRLFPDFDYYKTTYPRASKFILTIPFLWLIRVFRGITKHERIAGEVRRVKNK